MAAAHTQQTKASWLQGLHSAVGKSQGSTSWFEAVDRIAVPAPPKKSWVASLFLKLGSKYLSGKTKQQPPTRVWHHKGSRTWLYIVLLVAVVLLQDNSGRAASMPWLYICIAAWLIGGALDSWVETFGSFQQLLKRLCQGRPEDWGISTLVGVDSLWPGAFVWGVPGPWNGVVNQNNQTMTPTKLWMEGEAWAP